MAPIRRELIFSGRVQGVGFRYTSCQVASRYPVTGWVKNLGDGNVQMVVEGAADDIDRFIRDVELNLNDRGYGRVESCSQSGDRQASGEFDSFSIR